MSLKAKQKAKEEARDRKARRLEAEAARAKYEREEPFPEDGIRPEKEQRKPSGYFAVQTGTRKWYGKNGELLDGKNEVREKVQERNRKRDASLMHQMQKKSSLRSGIRPPPPRPAPEPEEATRRIDNSSTSVPRLSVEDSSYVEPGSTTESWNMAKTLGSDKKRALDRGVQINFTNRTVTLAVSTAPKLT